MPKIEINQKNVQNADAIIQICPFNAIEYINNEIIINAGCKMCKICTKNKPDIFVYIEDDKLEIDKDEYKGIAVFIECAGDTAHNVSLELLGKAQQMAEKINQPVHAVLVGYNVKKIAKTVMEYGADKAFVYDDINLKNFKVEPYTAVFEDYIKNNKPTVVLVGGTVLGRSLAPRVAARFRTGLTADCTVLDIQKNTDLDQIRPAFGGNIMAHIHTPNHRPQFATVRYKIFDMPQKLENPKGQAIICDVSNIDLSTKINTIEVTPKQKSESIEDAEVLIVAGAGVKDEKGLNLINELANLLGAKVACTRCMVENGTMHARHQIGLSGRTVRPKLIITCGVSGAIQFVAGMNASENIIAINKNKNASIFKVAHYALVGDLYEILPRLIDNAKNAVT